MASIRFGEPFPAVTSPQGDDHGADPAIQRHSSAWNQFAKSSRMARHSRITLTEEHLANGVLVDVLGRTSAATPPLHAVAA
jgi:hypothetical protein